MSSKPVQFFFGASTGRTGTMHLANVLNAEAGCTCVHEGKFRYRESSGEQQLPFLTLENRLAYEHPEQAAAIIEDKRALLDEVNVPGLTHFGDIAYNYCPFIGAVAERFPASRILAIVRDGRSFVRSATVLQGEDRAPVGWPPVDKPLTSLERYISMGRLQPRQNSPEAELWREWSAIEKNVWLWAETNRILFDALDRLDAMRYLVVRFEDFVSDPLQVYNRIRSFLGFRSELAESVRQVLLSPVINARGANRLPDYDDWLPGHRAHFNRYAGAVMQRLGYAYE